MPSPSWSRCSGWINKQSGEASLAREKIVKLVFYLLYCCAAIKSCGLSGILFKAMDQIEKFVKDSGLTISAYNVCFYDSNGTDEILDNILCGKKRANTGLFSLFEAQMQLLPRTGDYTVVLDSDMQPRCITRTTKVDVVPFEDVTADCAAAEGDGTLAAWKKAHRKAFAAACEEIGRNFDESMKCVCEYFDVVYRADGQ